jgi:hypothetical protein
MREDVILLADSSNRWVHVLRQSKTVTGSGNPDEGCSDAVGVLNREAR